MRPPWIIRVVGLKKSGKTTVARTLIRELSSRGLRVGALKTTEQDRLALGPEGADTERLAEAGAGVVVALLPSQTVRFERASTRSPAEVLALFPEGTDVLVCEGSLPGLAAQRTFVCVGALSGLGETLAVRGLLEERVTAVTGVGAAGARPGQTVSWRDGLLEVLDVLSEEGAQALGELAAGPGR
jgi:hypothetical protein